jgi:ABC-type Fe3+/spermidine/putrescine transport system ATPase subunit
VEVYYRPANEYVARFFGDNNLIEVTLGPAAAGGRTAESAIGSFHCTVAGLLDAAIGTPGKLLVRPEAIALGAGDGNRNRLPVSVEEVSFVGPISHVRVRASGRADVRLLIKLPSRAAGLPFEVGSATEISWSDRECHLVTS